jgi:hemerythrin-like metal-binding protein
MSSPNNTTPWELEWTDELSVGIAEIDAEHQRFILLVNQLNEAIVGRETTTEIKARLQAVIDDAESHFAHEEVLFMQWGYPEAGEHATRHQQVLKALSGIMANVGRNVIEYDLIEAGLTVKDVLIKHLLAEDMKYRDYCRNKIQIS